MFILHDWARTPTANTPFGPAGIAHACPWEYASRRQLAQLWVHESLRTYEDRLMQDAGQGGRGFLCGCSCMGVIFLKELEDLQCERTLNRYSNMAQAESNKWHRMQQSVMFSRRFHNRLYSQSSQSQGRTRVPCKLPTRDQGMWKKLTTRRVSYGCIILIVIVWSIGGSRVCRGFMIPLKNWCFGSPTTFQV